MAAVVNRNIVITCNEMLQNFSACGYQVKLDEYTPAEGNCFYHAITQQMRRPEFAGRISERFRQMDYHTLRRTVGEHVQIIHHNFEPQKADLIGDREKLIERDVQNKMDRYGLTYVAPNINESGADRQQRMITNLNTIKEYERRNDVRTKYTPPSEFSWDNYFLQQSSNGQNAEEIWVRATAHMLGVSIHASTPGANVNTPVHKLSHRIVGGAGGADVDDNDTPFFILGNAHNHFQSFLPLQSADRIINHEISNPMSGPESSRHTYADVLVGKKRMSPPRKKACNNIGTVTSAAAKLSDNIDVTRQTEKREQIENVLREIMMGYKLHYVYPPPGETQNQQKNRWHRFQLDIKHHEEKLDEENSMIEAMKLYNIPYKAPPHDESINFREKRLGEMRDIFEKCKTNNMQYDHIVSHPTKDQSANSANGDTVAEKQSKQGKTSSSVPKPSGVSIMHLQTWDKQLPAMKVMLHKDAAPINDQVNAKISLWQGDITSLRADCIVNAAKSNLQGGGGVDGAIHHHAGPVLKVKCATEYPNGCKEGQSVITDTVGCNLLCNHVIHTVGPQDRNEKALRSCYESCLDIILSNSSIKTIAFPCIATGAFGFNTDKEAACEIALSSVRDWLERHHSSVERVIFCTFRKSDFVIYNSNMLKRYFPRYSSSGSTLAKNTGAKNKKTKDSDDDIDFFVHTSNATLPTELHNTAIPLNANVKQKTELSLKEKMLYYGLKYIAPSSEKESDRDRVNRHKRLRYAINTYEKNSRKDTELSLKEKMLLHGLEYIAPSSEKESDRDRCNRHQRIHYAISTYEKNSQKDTELSLKEKMLLHGLEYIAPSSEKESDRDRVNRHQRVRYAINTHEKNDPRMDNTELSLKDKMLSYGLEYIAPSEDESATERENRLQRFHYAIHAHEDNIQKICADQGIHFDVPDAPAIVDGTVLQYLNDIVDTVSEYVDSENREENLEYLHSSPEVQEAVLKFEASETKHTIGKCVTCHQVRPVFHVEKYSKRLPAGRPPPMHGESWKLDKNGRCDTCRKDKYACNRKAKDLQKKKQKINMPNISVRAPAKYSGIYSSEEDMAFDPTTDLPQRHNDMHFRKVPPYLKGLTTTETALISKISVLMNVHVLKTGMFASRGHCVSLPQAMNEAKQLPLLPAEVNIVVLKRIGADGKIKHYFVKRSAVQESLEGLCYGYPHGGCDESNGLNTERYMGKDHAQMPLNGRYFQYIPNPYYHDVEIMYDRLNNLPDESSLWSGLTVIERQDVYGNNVEHPLNPEDPVDITHSGLIRPLHPTENDDVEKLLKKIVGNSDALDKLLESRNAIQMSWNRIDSDPIPELKTPGFFAMAYPTLFIAASCDITVQRLVNIDYKEWVEHIYYNVDNRVAAHPYLKFFLLNLRMRTQALSQGSFLVSQQLNDAHLSISELRDKLVNNDTSVPRKVTSIASNFVNTDPYWRERNKELDAIGVYRKKEKGDVMTHFRTHSCAEFHWVPFHELLIQHYALTNDEDVNDVRDKFHTDNEFKVKLIQENHHICTHHFDARHLNYVNTVDMALFDCDDIWFRYEFAPLRGVIHAHKCLHSNRQWKVIQDAYNQIVHHNSQSQEETDDQSAAAHRLEQVLQTNTCNDENFTSPEFVSLHPAGGEINQNDGVNQWVPNKTNWAAPEGTGEPPEINPLTQELENILHIKDGVKNLHIDLCNKIGLHKCSKSYCLKLPRKKPTGDADTAGQSNNDGSKQPRVCKFHFGEYDESTKTSAGKDLHPFEPTITEGEHPRYEGRRDHPRFLQHTTATLLSWKANSDTQVVLKQNLLALQNYLTQYACKGAAKTSDFIKIYEMLLQELDDSISVKSLCQRLLLKIVGYVDCPEACADFLNTGGKLYRCTRNFRRVGLSGYRTVDQDAVNSFATSNSNSTHNPVVNNNTARNPGNAVPGPSSAVPALASGNHSASVSNQPQQQPIVSLTRQSAFDQFMSDKRRLMYPEITLYDWAKMCDQKCSCNCDHVPLFTGVLTRPQWPPSEDLSKSLLMIYSPGTWTYPDDLKEGHNTFIEAFADFLDADLCPVHLKEMMDEAKDKYDKKQERITRSRMQVNNSQSSQPALSLPSSQQSYSSSQSSVRRRFSYRESMLQDIADGEYQDDPELDAPINTGAPDFDWHNFGQECIGDIMVPDNAEHWVEQTSDVAQEHFFQEMEEVNLTESNLLLANEMQRIAISIMAKHLFHIARHGDNCHACENEEQIAMLLGGTAGTGKTFVLNGINRIAQRLFQRNGAVLNLAPTGAASVLIPNGRTIHSVIPMPRNKSKKEMLSAQLCDYPMQSKRQKLLRRYTGTKEKRTVQALIVDERSQIPHDILAWTDHRFSEATLDESTFGGVPATLLSGDNGQLGPNGGTDMHLKPKEPITPIEDRGYALYRTHFNTAIVLEETMRQGPDQLDLLNMLLRIRTGEITQDDWNNINARHEGNLTADEKINFQHDKVITLCETTRDVNMENRIKLNELSAQTNVPIAIIPAINNGQHTRGKYAEKAVGQIPPVAELIVGGRYIITKNQYGLTGYKLNNGAMGTLKAIIYDENMRPPQHPKYVIMDMPNYNGPPCFPDQPSWIPIAPQTGLCDKMCCTRIGIPLAPAYALTICKAQGMTIGSGKMVTHMRLKLQKHSKFENLCPGTTYVGLSRVDKNSAWTLVDTIDWTRLSSINSHDTILKRRVEDVRLKNLHNETIAKHAISENEYLQLLRDIDDFCNNESSDQPPIYDSMCQSDDPKCSCVSCTVAQAG